MRWAIVGSGTRNARAISSVLSPPSRRRVNATCAGVDSTGWQAVNTSRSRSSPIGSSSLSRCASSALSCSASSSRASSSCLRCSSLLRRRRSIARCLAVAMSQAPGWSGTPVSGQRSSAATSASCASSSARPTSRTMRASVAISLADSMRHTASMLRWMSVAVMATDHTTDVVPLQVLEVASRAFQAGCRGTVVLAQALEVAEPFLEGLADHAVHVHEHAEHLGDIRHVAIHRPGHVAAIALRHDGELRGAARLHRPGEIKLHLDARGGHRLHDLHPSGAGLVVAVPPVSRAGAVCGTTDLALHLRIELLVRRPRAPAVEVVDLREHLVRWCLNVDVAFDAERVRAGCGEDEDGRDQYDDGDGD